jgi:leucyl aminopeptidase
MQLQYQSALSTSDEALICPIFFTKKNPELSKFPKPLQDLIKTLLKNKQFESKEGSVFEMPLAIAKLPKNILLVSLGEESKVKAAKVRNAIAGATKALRAQKRKAMTLWYPEELNKYARVIGEAVVMSNHLVGRYRTGKTLEEDKKRIIGSLNVVTASKAAIDAELKKGMSVGDVVNTTRDLINDPPNVLTAKALAEVAKKIAKDNSFKITVLEKKDLQKLKMGALLAVNRGCERPEDDARLVVLEYMPNKNEKPIALVGKGIIFDSGGYDLKPSRHMADMQQDMSGAAVVLGVFNLIKKLGIKRNVIGIAAITANLIGPNAYKSTEIITSYSGKTIEITNTDAEGRVVLCDAISYAVKQYKPKQVIDIATLTGAVCVALGDRYAAMMGTDKDGMKLLKKAGNRTDDLVWELPIHPDFEGKMKSKIADIRNSEDGYYAGSQKGGAFLKNFIEKTPWIHLDIAGTAFTSDPKKYESVMGTGYGVRLLTNYLENL